MALKVINETTLDCSCWAVSPSPSPLLSHSLAFMMFLLFVESFFRRSLNT